jgi:hypothetical protein
MWLHILVGLFGVCAMHCSEVDCSLLPNSAILTTVTLASMSNALADDVVTALKHVRAVLM